MFEKLKQIQELKNQAGQLKKILAEISVEATAIGGSIKVIMNGNQEIKEIKIDTSLAGNTTKIEEGVKQAVNEAIKEAQKVMAQKISHNFSGF